MKLAITIPDDKVAEYIRKYVRANPNTEMIDDPEWTPPEEGSKDFGSRAVVAEQIPKYTDAAWVKEHIVRAIRKQIIRGNNLETRDAEEIGNADDVT